MNELRDIWVGDREVRPSLNEIRLGMERVHIEPRSMEVLGELVRNAPEVVPKERLIAAVWGDAIVTDEVLTHAIWDLRRAFGDSASSPEFIQTIPKKGYRLIAPVKEIERDGGGAGRAPGPAAAPRRPRVRPWIWALALATVLAVIAFRLGRRPAPPAPAATERPELILVATDSAPETEELAQRLDLALRTELFGLPGTDIRQHTACDPAAVGSYCLEAVLLTGTDLYEVSTTLTDAATGQVVFSPPPARPRGRTELADAGREIAAQIAAFLEVSRNPFFRDPDITPWLRLQRYDIRAIRDFLDGVRYVYRNETGAGPEMLEAIERDADFLAPWVWSTPAVAQSGDLEAIAERRAQLERLGAEASGFEKAMIRWGTALLDDSVPEQVRHLRVALEAEPGNRQVKLALGVALMQQREFDRAWQVLEPLVAARWQFPGLYPVAGRCALHIGQLEQAAFALEAAIETDPIDPESLALLRLLAIYNGEERDAQFYGDWLASRLAEMEPEVVEIDLSEHATRLAARAAREGRPQVATRLRESAG